MKKYKHAVMMLLLVVATLIVGYSFFAFMATHVWLFLLVVFCIVGALSLAKED